MRLDRALLLAEAVAEFFLSLVASTIAGNSLRPLGNAPRANKEQLPTALPMGWILLSKKVAVALSYDAGFVDPHVLLPLGQRLCNVTDYAAECMIGGRRGDLQQELLSIALNSVALAWAM